MKGWFAYLEIEWSVVEPLFQKLRFQMSAAAISALFLSEHAPREGDNGANRGASSDREAVPFPGRQSGPEGRSGSDHMSITENDPVVRPWYGESEKRTDFA